MFVYFTRRLLYLIPMLLGISFLIYLGLELTPGDVLSYLLPPEAIADLKPEEIVEWLEGLTTEQFKKVTDFFTTMPKLKHSFTIKNTNTGKDFTITLEGLADFF